MLQSTIKHTNIWGVISIIVVASLLVTTVIISQLSVSYEASDLTTKETIAGTHEIPSNTHFTTRVAIIGGAGYIGSFLALALQRNDRFHVSIFDKDPKLDANILSNSNISIPVITAHSGNLTKDDLAQFGTVIFLGGCTGRKACEELTVQEVERENVINVINVVKKMSSSQHFIAASTSAIAEGTFGAKEDAQVNVNLLDSYSLSMFKREIRIKKIISHDTEHHHPQISLLRFGTVVGNSPGQRTDLMIPSFFRSAYTTGALLVAGHNTMRSFLTLDDLSDAFISLMSQTDLATNSSMSHFNVWNLASFNATVFKVAATVASLTGAKIDASPSSTGETNTLLSRDSGFSLSTKAFTEKFNFKFKGSLSKAMNDFDSKIPESIIPKGPHCIAENESGKTVPCPVCGATGQQTVLDLGSQPLANDFFPDINDAITRPRFPLKLVRCRVCNHYHLSHIVDRSDLFDHYLYQSGTSATLSEYFEWLAKKVILESGLPATESGSVLEIACNDGSQLDHYKTKGWNTFGVDPAANLAAIAGRNHIVKNGFWPTEFPELPKGNDLTAITAQNVVAHVPDVVTFLKGCANVMGPKTILYIQTSQCNMQQFGQFDTVYHEHISFFTGHSFLKAANLSGLVIISFETTPIHGESCLVKMQLNDTKMNKRGAITSLGSSSVVALSPSLSDRLLKEKEDGITSEFFAMKFSAHATVIRDWLKGELLSVKKQGGVVGGYGAAAKGMVLLHFIIGDGDDGSSYLDFVLDDAKLKQNTFCPGTVIPVKPISGLQKYNDPTKPLVIMVFAWNFFDEIAKNIISMIKETRDEVLFIIPFPSPRVIRVDLKNNEVNNTQVIRELSYLPTPIPNPITHNEKRTKAIMVTHQRNEELLMPFFIMQHAPMFDKVILIDFESDDRTLEILERFAPPSWEVIDSATGSVFDAAKTDEQVMAVEKAFPNDWLIALTTTEFLNKPHFRQYLQQFEKNRKNKDKPFISQIQGFDINGNNTKPLIYSEPLPKQRQLGDPSLFYSRYLHYKTSNSYHYSPGRHKYQGEGAEQIRLDAFIFKFCFAPWPEVKNRKMNIGKTVPESDRLKKWGTQHVYRANETYIDAEYDKIKTQNFGIDFCSDTGTASEIAYKCVYNQLYGKCS